MLNTLTDKKVMNVSGFPHDVLPSLGWTSKESCK